MALGLPLLRCSDSAMPLRLSIADGEGTKSDRLEVGLAQVEALPRSRLSGEDDDGGDGDGNGEYMQAKAGKGTKRASGSGAARGPRGRALLLAD